MRELTGYFYNYFRQEHKIVLILCTLFTTVLIMLNYSTGLNASFLRYGLFNRFLSYFFLFTFAFVIPYLLLFSIKKTTVLEPLPFLILLIGGSALFALKISFNGFTFPAEKLSYPWNEYMIIVAKWPWKFLLVVCGISLLTFYTNSSPQLPGLSNKNIRWKPYLYLLLCTIPLIVLAATQSDFLQTYPKLKTISFILHYSSSPIYPLLFELAYGLDFVTIELFFRGFLIVAFIRFVGIDAILPMAVFYCTIHFGKPLGECITSYFGGLLLGVVTYHTRSIYGGLMVHLGIAWMMEAVASVAGGIY